MLGRTIETNTYKEKLENKQSEGKTTDQNTSGLVKGKPQRE